MRSRVSAPERISALTSSVTWRLVRPLPEIASLSRSQVRRLCLARVQSGPDATTAASCPRLTRVVTVSGSTRTIFRRRLTHETLRDRWWATSSSPHPSDPISSSMSQPCSRALSPPCRSRSLRARA